MTADPGRSLAGRDIRFALFTNGTGFGREVLRSLRELQYSPALLVLPEYAPAARAEHDILGPAPMPQLLQLAPEIETGFAPQSLQVECAGLIRQQSIDFILVACWPYLIDAVLINSAGRAALNLHPSLLPAHRGVDPITSQLADKKSQFGVSLHLLDQYFDRGDIVAQAMLDDSPQSPTRRDLERDCAVLGSRLFIDAINGYDAGWNPLPQN